MDTIAAALADRYRIERELGRGGMGVVYLARELRLDRDVALKVLPPELAALPELRERFVREARTAAQLAHPNIVPIYHADESAGFAFFAMGYVDGESLAERLRQRGRLAPAETVRILREIAWALAYAHARGVVHRDIKPENVMLERGSERVLVTDFGIARDSRSSPLTLEGSVLGSVHFMSPEQATGGAIDGRSDLYAVGVVGFLALTGALPFAAAAPGAVLVMHATQAPPRVRETAPDVPEALARVIDRCLAKSPDDRYPTGEALAEALAAALSADRTPPAGSPPARVLAPEEAQAVWVRAAQLQQDAASRIRQHTRALEAGGMATASYRLEDVVSAAEDAGIGREFVQLALMEQGGAGTGSGDGRSVGLVPLGDAAERRMTWLLGTSERSIRVAHIVEAAPARVLEALGRIVTAPPYLLKLVGTAGGHPLDGGVMQFHRDIGMNDLGSAGGVNMFAYRLHQLELDDLRVTLRPVGADRRATEVVVYGDLRPGMRKNLRASHWIAGGVGGAGVAIAVAKAGAAAAVALLPALPVGAALAALSYGLYRLSYRGALRGTEQEVRKMLEAVGGSVRAAEVFGPGGTAAWHEGGQVSPPAAQGGDVPFWLGS